MKAVVVVLAFLILLTTGCTTSATYLERGKKLFEAGKYEDASLNFRKALQKDQTSSEAYYRLGLSDIHQTDFAGAYSALLHANQLLPERQDVKVALANVCVEAYHSDAKRPKVLYDQLVKLTNQIAAKDPGGYDTLRLRGYVALIDKQVKEGIGYFDRANRLKPYQSEVVVNLVDALTQDQQFHEAERLGEETIQHEKADGLVYDALYLTYLTANDPQGAESVLKRKAANNPKRPDYALQLASYYVQVQKSSEVPAIIKGVLDRGTQFPQVYLEVGNFYSSLRNWEEAKRLYELGIGKDPRNKIAYQKRIIAVLLAQNKKEEAARMVDTILQEAPRDQNALQVQAVLLLNTREPENIDKALAQFQLLIQQAPKDVALRIHLAEAYIAKSDWSAARKELSEVLRLNPSTLQARLLLAEIAYTQRQPSEVLLQVTPIITVDPSNARARLLHAIALMGLGNAVDARNELERLIRDQPKYVDAQIELGLFDLAEKKTQAAEAIFRKFYDPGRTNPEALQGLVTILTLRGQSEEAFRLVDQEAKKSPNPGALRFLLASVATHAGKDDVALEQLQETVKENPRASDAYLLLADIYNRRGDLVEALGVLGKAHAVDPKDFRPVVLMAALEDREGERPQAIASYREAVALRPEDPNLLNDAAYYFAENGGNLDEALQMSRQSVEKLKGQGNASDTLAWIYLKKNMTEPALEILTTLVKKYPDAAVYRYHLGAALAAKGDRERARAELRAALLKKPAKQDEAKIRELLARLG